MTNYLEIIVDAIRNSNVISIIYDNGGDDYYRKIRPYYLFLHRQKPYLLALSDGKSDVSTFRIEKIKEVQLTPLLFNDSKKSIMEYVKDNTCFKGHIESIHIDFNTSSSQIISVINKKSCKYN